MRCGPSTADRIQDLLQQEQGFAASGLAAQRTERRRAVVLIRRVAAGGHTSGVGNRKPSAKRNTMSADIAAIISSIGLSHPQLRRRAMLAAAYARFLTAADR